MCNKYGSLKYLSENTARKIEIVINRFDEINMEYSIYYGYPIIDELNHKEYVKGFVITIFGIFILYEYEEERDTFASCFLNHITIDSSLMRISREFSNYIKFIDLKDCEKLNLLDFNQDIILDDNEILKINRAIQKSYNLTKEDKRKILRKNSLGEEIKKGTRILESMIQHNLIWYTHQ